MANTETKKFILDVKNSTLADEYNELVIQILKEKVMTTQILSSIMLGEKHNKEGYLTNKAKIGCYSDGNSHVFGILIFSYDDLTFLFIFG